jgi:hypothetical protein
VIRLTGSFTLVALLTACGTTAPLRPKSGDSLPPKPLAARSAPDAERLMTPTPQSRPQRTDDLLRNSDERTPDRFDLPPPG